MPARIARVRALLFLLAALLIGLSPAAALAHDGVAHGDGEQAAAGSSGQSWSPLCPPGSGHVCGCGNLSLCEGSAKPVVLVRCTVFFLPPRVAAPAPLPEAAARIAPRFPPALPRAPPAFS
jgi:hypothetical protein